jgi:hypothetical protein
MLIVFFASQTLAQVRESRAWKMKDGREVNAIGVSVNFGGVLLRAPQGDRQIFFPFKNLSPSEAKDAVQNLPILMGGSENFKLSAKTVATTRDNYKVVTGYAITLPSSVRTSSSSGNSMSTSSGGVQELTKRESKSSKVIELKMTSLCDGVAVWVDFLVIGDGKAIMKHEKGVYFFSGTDDVILFDFPPTVDYKAWAFVFRSIESGAILGSQASIQPLAEYAENFIKNTGESSKQTSEDIKKALYLAVIKE